MKRVGLLVTIALLLPIRANIPFSSPPAVADIYRWDNGELITTVDAEPFARFSGMDLSYADLAEANLARANFSQTILSAANFTGANLDGAVFYGATLTSADFTEAVIEQASFGDTTSRGLTAKQFYSTASYQDGNLYGIRLRDNDLSGWDFAKKRLARADFSLTKMASANFSGANLVHAAFAGSVLTGADLTEANLSEVAFEQTTLTSADFSGAVIADAMFRSTTGFTAAQFYSTATYQDDDLSRIRLEENDLSGWDFVGKNLTAANFRRSTLVASNFAEADLTGATFQNTTLTSADFSEAIVTGTTFYDATSRGFTAEQFYSTASYQDGNLGRIRMSFDDLSRWDFAGKNLQGANFFSGTLTSTNFAEANLAEASFWRATLASANFAGANLVDANFEKTILTDTNLTFSDLRGAYIDDSQLRAAASTERAILPDGRIEGVALDAEERLVVHDYDPAVKWWTPDPPISIPITVESGMSLGPGAALRMVFADDDWGSTISFEPGIDVALGGSLELLFDGNTEPGDLVGTTFDLFDWEGAVVSGTFQDEILTDGGAVWDTTRLYTTGQVTLLAVPEPGTLVLLACGLMGLAVAGLRRRGV